MNKAIISALAIDKALDSAAVFCSNSTSLQDWKQLSNEDVEAALQEARSHWSARHGGRIRLSCAALLAASVVFTAEIPAHLIFGPMVAGVLLFSGGVIGAAAAHLALKPLEWPRRFIDLLSSAKELPTTCAAALESVEQFDESRAYRDAIVEQGRELTKLDLRVINRIAVEANAKKSAIDAAEKCRRLHGLIEA